MASPILHIKDAYYFDVPKFLWRADYQGVAPEANNPFPEFWVRLDPDYQLWEAKSLYDSELKGRVDDLPEWSDLRHEFLHWQHEGTNHGKPFTTFILETKEWFPESDDFGQSLQFENYTAHYDEHPWSQSKIDSYNTALHGRVLIPQPFGQLKNLYQPASGFCISKFMIIEVVVGLIIMVLFIRLAAKLRSSNVPKGRLTNMLEAILVFMRDEVARPAIGHGADKFVPLLWTIFFFVLGCNLMGMLPWAGAPTASFSVTLALAGLTFLTGVVTGSIKFGPIGFWLNQVPSMDLPLVMAVVLKPMLWVIEVVGLFIKHAVLGVRLLANMLAGHMVLLGIMGIAFSIEGASTPLWWITAPMSVVGSTLFSCLELFVAFLQAYIFVFLSALFIGAANHRH